MSWTWIGVDFDGTLAMAEPGVKHTDALPPPVPAMVERVKQWLSEGKDVRIVTARVSPTFDDTVRDPEGQYALLDAWCLEHIGQTLPITCSKDYGLSMLYDDRAIQVERNTGRLITEDHKL